MREFFFDGRVRMDWGFENPNVTGSLIAMAMAAAWIIALWGRWGFWLALTANAALGMSLVQTFSRGALVAAVVGLAVLAWAARPWHKLGVIACCVVAGGLTVYAWELGAAKRYSQGFVSDDASLGNRWLIYQTAPRMLWDAPEGWGAGRSGEAFMQWYQPPGRLERYRHLVNSHATWLAEWGWIGRVAYVSVWVAILHWFWNRRGRNKELLAVASAVWISFGTAAAFNTIFHRWQLWCLPLLFLGIAVVTRACTRSLPSWKSGLAMAAIGNATFLLVTGSWAFFTPVTTPVKLEDGTVQLRRSSDKQGGKALSVLAADQKVLGEFYGHRLREELLEPGTPGWSSVFVAWRSGSVPPVKGNCVVASGEGASALKADTLASFADAERVVFLNPGPAPAFLQDAASSSPAIEVLFGERFTGISRYSWEVLANNNPRVKIESIPMAGTFVPRWTQSLHEQPKGS